MKLIPNEWTARRTDGRTDGRTDKWMDRQKKHFPPFLIQKRRESMTDQGYRWPFNVFGLLFLSYPCTFNQILF